MTASRLFLIRMAGRFTLFIASVLLVLFAANVRSHFYYHGPSYGFLFWIFLYCLITGVGLLKLRRWAVLLLFLPGTLMALIFVYATWAKNARVPMPWAILNYGLTIAALGIPAAMLRHWNELRW